MITEERGTKEPSDEGETSSLYKVAHQGSEMGRDSLKAMLHGIVIGWSK